MMIKKAFLAATAAILLSTLTTSGQGLEFSGMDYSIDRRTSYNVFGSDSRIFHGTLDLDFELYTEPPSVFGYFLRIKDGYGSKRIWNLSYDRGGDSVVVRLNEEGRHSLIKATLPHEKLQRLHWYRIGLHLDMMADSVDLSIGDEHFSCNSEKLPDTIRPTLEFGRSDHIIDVPSFAIRNLRISNDRYDFSFPLDQSKGNNVYDSALRVKGHVQNPKWLINESVEWKAVDSLQMRDIAGACYNPARKEFYYFSQRKLFVVRLLDDSTDEIDLNEACPVDIHLGSNFISADGNSLICYEVYNDEVEDGTPAAAILDLNSLEWKTLGNSRLDMPMHHHATFRNPATGRYNIFGGFGAMRYNGRFFEFGTDGIWREVWAQHGGDAVYPRYFTSAGTDSTGIYLFGGMGNESGEQVVGRRYFYDFYRIDPETGGTEKLWDLERIGDGEMVPVRNLIVDGDHFHTLCYPEFIEKSALQLYRFDIRTGQHETVGNKIPIMSDKMRTNANIWYDAELKKLFATTLEFEDDIRSKLRIWSLTYPPVSQKDIAAREHSGTATFLIYNRTSLLSALLLVILAIAGTACYRRHGRGQEEVDYSNEKPSARRLFKYGHAPNSISLFGDLTITDSTGQDITPAFKNQQLTTLCLLIRRGQEGMSSKRLSDILWPDKEGEKAKNSRCVAINNLRKSLSTVDGVDVDYQGGRYYLRLEAPCTCDYNALLSALSENGDGKATALSILSQGKFLKSMTDNVFDSFKEEVEGMTFPFLKEALASYYKARNSQAVYEVGRMLLDIDPTDEDTFKMVVRSLKRQRRTEEALVFYSSFCSEYKKENDEDYPVAFKSI